MSTFSWHSRRFVSRRGTPHYLLSDNGSQFKLARSTIDLAFEKSLTSENVLNYCAANGIKWNFIVELSPWIRGFYERMVGVVKSSIKKTIGRTALTLTQLNTLIADVEAVINSRPLVYLEDEPGNALTPAHFLSGKSNIGLPQVPIDFDDPEFVVNMSSADLLLTL